MIVDHKVPKIQIIRKEDSSQATGVAVIIDVLRSFTTAAYAFGSGAEKIILTSKLDEAAALAKAIPGALTVGDENKKPIKGFNFDNSPWSFTGHDLTGKILIHYNASSAHDIALNLPCKNILASSFVVAEATIARMHTLGTTEVSFIITGNEDGSEDQALAEYFQARLSDKYDGHLGPYLRKVSSSPIGKYLHQRNDEYPLSDLDAALAVDAFPFAMEIIKEGGLTVIQPIRTNGTIWR